MKIFYTLLLSTLFGLNINAQATFSSISAGTWSVAATWTITSGTDANGVPDLDDDVIINTGHTVTMSSRSAAKNLTVAASSTLTVSSQIFDCYGNFINNGTITGTIAPFFYGANSTFSSSTLFTNTGDWHVKAGTLTIGSGTSISKQSYITINSGTQVINKGSVNLIGGAINFIGTSVWLNDVNSSLTLARNNTGSGVLDASANSNTVTYGFPVTSIKGATYYNLTLLGNLTKSVTANVTTLNNFTLGTPNTFNVLNLNNFSFTIGGNWINNSNSTVINQGDVIFNGSGVQTISRASTEIFKNLTISATGTVSLARNINVTQNLTINSGLLDVTTSNFAIDIKGNLTNDGAINCRQGLISFTGTGSQTISGTQGTSFNNLTTANTAGVTVLSNVAVFNILRVNSGSFGTSGSGIITIPASGPTTYARIAAVGGSLIGTGWILESYINGPTPKGWQWLSSPISGTTLADWDNDPRFYMSGVGGNDGNSMSGNGIFFSVRTYDEVTNTYANITTTTTPLTPGKGFQLWMSDNTVGLTSPLVYNSVGTPNFGTISFPVTAGGAGSGYNLVGNPFACPINYNSVVAASGNLFSSFIILLEDNTYSTNPNGGIIAPNQGFMCVASTGGNIVFPESAKNIVTSPNILKTAAQANAVTFSVYNNVNGIGGRTYIDFSDEATDNFENGTDLSFLVSPSEESDNIYTKSMDQVALLRNMLPNNGEEKIIPLTVKSGVYGSHFISVKGLSDLHLYNTVWLEDLTTGKQIDLLKNQEYEYNAEEIGKEYEFMVHFSNAKKSTGNTGITNANLLNENTSVYNTPSNVVVKFNMDKSTPVTISVFNLAGQKVIDNINVNVTDDRIALPLQKENGLYLLLIQSENEQITRKIIY